MTTQVIATCRDCKKECKRDLAHFLRAAAPRCWFCGGPIDYRNPACELCGDKGSVKTASGFQICKCDAAKQRYPEEYYLRQKGPKRRGRGRRAAKQRAIERKKTRGQHWWPL